MKVLRKVSERMKLIYLSVSIIFIWSIILTGLAYGVTDVSGIATTSVTGNFVVGGDVYYKSAIGGLPSGSILMYTTACPTGWTRQTLFDGRYVRIATTAGSTAGASTHSGHSFTHYHSEVFSTISGGGNHQHGGSDGSLSAVGNHQHYVGGNRDGTDGSYGFSNGWTDAISGGHSHYFSYGTGFTNDAHTHSVSGNSGSSAVTDGSANNDPTRISVVLCKKN